MPHVCLLALIILELLENNHATQRAIIFKDEPVIDISAASISAMRVPKDEADPRTFLIRLTRSEADARHGVWYKIALEGTMTPWVDFRPPPPYVFMDAGVQSIDLQIQLFDDSEGEGQETLGINPTPVRLISDHN